MNVDLPEHLSRRLHQPLPGPAAQKIMEPDLSFGRHTGPSRYDARPAAVVAMLYVRNGQWHLPLMLRPETLAHHAGQISLPGGMIEPNETSDEGALRELEEELGIGRSGVLLLGQLSPLYLFGTNFLISAWVAVVRGGVQLLANPTEVQAVLEVPLQVLINPASRGQHIQQRGSLRFAAPHFAWHEHKIWGATSMILAELVAVIGQTAV